MSIVTKIKATVAAVVLAATLPVTATAGDMAEKDIVDTAASAGDFNTLVTVFAPTDEAFAKIPEDQLNALLADKEQLTAVLTYHVVAGKVMAADVAGLESATTVEGQDIRIDTSDGVKVNDANVIKTDIVASNGVIHVIDTVIIPE